MKSKFVLAQVSSSGDVAANLEKAKKMMARAYEEHHPDVMVFPEVFMAHFPVGTPKRQFWQPVSPLTAPLSPGCVRKPRNTACGSSAA